MVFRVRVTVFVLRVIFEGSSHQKVIFHFRYLFWVDARFTLFCIIFICIDFAFFWLLIIAAATVITATAMVPLDRELIFQLNVLWSFSTYSFFAFFFFFFFFFLSSSDSDDPDSLSLAALLRRLTFFTRNSKKD